MFCILSSFPFISKIFIFLRATPMAYGSSQARGQNWSYRWRPTPQPQQIEIQALSAICTTAQGNAGSLTPLERWGMERASSWILAGLVSAEPPQELPYWKIFNAKVRISVEVGFQLKVELELGLARKDLRLDEGWCLLRDLWAFRSFIGYGTYYNCYTNEHKFSTNIKHKLTKQLNNA